MMTNINRGNRFTQLVSYATKSRGLHEYIVKNGGENHPNAKVNFKLGDIVTTMIRTANDDHYITTRHQFAPTLLHRLQGSRHEWYLDGRE